MIGAVWRLAVLGRTNPRGMPGLMGAALLADPIVGLEGPDDPLQLVDHRVLGRRIGLLLHRCLTRRSSLRRSPGGSRSMTPVVPSAEQETPFPAAIRRPSQSRLPQ